MLKHLFGGNSGVNSTMGLYHMLGAEPISRQGSQHTWAWGAKRFAFSDNARLVPRPMPSGEWSKLGAAFSIGAVGASAFTIAEGLATGGIGGAANRLIIETQVNKALVKHAYHMYEDGNITKYSPGIFTRPSSDWTIGAFGKKFKVPKAITKTLGAATDLANFGDFFTRAVMGSVAGSMVSGALGGGLLGTVGGSLAGGMATKHAWKLMGAGMLAAGAYGVYKGTSTVLKAGYNYRQNQKRIDTAGSLAAFSTQGAYTMRQRAVQAIHKSHLNARSALGQEANFMHMPQKNYNSYYR